MLVLRNLLRLAAAGLCLALLVLGLVKASDVEAFGQTVTAHGLLPGPLAAVGALGAIVLEVGLALLALLMLMLQRPRASLLLLGILFTVFTAYSFGLVLNPPAEAVSCGCGFSRAPVERWEPIMARNAGVAAACFAAIAVFSRPSLHGSPQISMHADRSEPA